MNAEIVKDVIASSESFKAACAVRGALQDARAAIARLIMEGLALELSERENFSGMKLKHDGLYKFVEDTGRSHQYWHGFSVEEIESSKSAFRLNFEFQDKGALTNFFMGVTRWNCDKERAAKFYKVAKEDEVLKGKYGFYLEDGNGWMYGAYPTDSELRFWADDFLTRNSQKSNLVSSANFKQPAPFRLFHITPKSQTPLSAVKALKTSCPKMPETP